MKFYLILSYLDISSVFREIPIFVMLFVVQCTELKSNFLTLYSHCM